MPLDFLLGDKTSIFTHDSFTVNHLHGKNLVKFICLGKHRAISGVLSGPLNISANSTWTSLFNAVNGMGSDVIDTIDNFAQGLYGNTIRQPWFGRKFWQGTKPLSFQIPLQFVSFKNAKEEVFDPAMGLLSLVFPRLDSKNNSAKMFAKYFIPGPTVFYSPTDHYADTEGDRVSVYFGNFLRFDGCYITGVALTVENSFSLEGYPHNVKATVTFETMDVSYVNHDGSFMEDGFRDSSIQIAGWVAQLRNKVKEMTSAVGNSVKNLGLGDILNSGV